MLLFDKLAEKQIDAAVQRGELSGLPGEGKPLPIDDMSMVPEQFRMAWKILKNAGFAPPEIAIHRKIGNLQPIIGHETDPGIRQQQMKKLVCLLQRLDDSPQRSMNLALQEEYYQKILHQLE